jgi:hypothetical protein
VIAEQRPRIAWQARFDSQSRILPVSTRRRLFGAAPIRVGECRRGAAAIEAHGLGDVVRTKDALPAANG